VEWSPHFFKNPASGFGVAEWSLQQPKEAAIFSYWN
jgi:hypothetical protein